MTATHGARKLASYLHRHRSAETRNGLIKVFGRRAFESARTAGFITEILPGTYVSHLSADDMAARLSAASRWISGRGLISGEAACGVHGLTVPASHRITVVSSTLRRESTPEWIRLRRLKLEVPPVIHSGHLVAALPHALVQAWWDAGPDVGRGLVIEAARQRKHVTRQVLNASALYPRLPHRQGLKTLAHRLTPGIESYLEYLADTTVLNTPDLRHLKKQVQIIVGSRRFRLDVFDEETKTTVEFDGRAFHGGDEARQRDTERDAILMTQGIMTLRFTYEQVATRPEWCRDTIRATLASRRSH